MEEKENSLRSLRQKKGFTVKALAEKSGVSSIEISAIERGKRIPWAGTIKKLAGALGVEFDKLYDSLQKEQ
jgi:transcriptional regulator with XRE-family HTH domain